MFKARNNLLPTNVQKSFNLGNSNNYTTRQHGNFKHVSVRTETKARNITVYGVKLWNSLNKSLTCIKNYIFSKDCINKKPWNHIVYKA